MNFNLKSVLSVFFLSLLLIPLIITVALKSNQTSYALPAMSPQMDDQPVQNVTFRLLAVEAYSNNTASRSAQHLIENLRLFSNWRNGTVSPGFQYFSYIHLLSNVNYEQIDPECQPYYRGNATRANIVNEIPSFLNQTLLEDDYAFSVQVLYYAGYSNKAVSQGNTTYYMALDEPLFDWELNQMLPSNTIEGQKPTIIILDTFYSGGYITNLACPGRVTLAACNPVETPIVGWFTGHENAVYPNGTNFGPLGIIGATRWADDINNDGWLSADEIFRFAWLSLTHFAANQTDPYSLHPWASYCVAGGGIPFVQLDESKPFPGNAKVCIPRQILPTSSRYDWNQFDHPMYRQSLSRTGFAPTIGPKTPDLLWASSLNYSATTSAVVADGIVFVGTFGGRFYALDMKTGSEVWSFLTNSPVSSSPAIKDGIVVFGTDKPQGKIYALDAYTGLVRWLYEIPTGAGVYSSPAIVDGMVFIGCSDGYLRCFSQFEGKPIWSTYIGGGSGKLSSPAIADNTVFVTSPHVYALDMLTGVLIWEYSTRWPVFSCPAVANGLVFVGSENDDSVFALEQNTGELVWTFRTGGWLTSPAVDNSRNLVIVGSKDARVYCIDKPTGLLKWQYINAPNHLSAPTISANGLVYIGSSDGNLYCIDEETGQEVWRYDVGSPIVSSPSIVYEHIIVTSEEGKVFCFGPPFPKHNVAVSKASISRLKVRVGASLEVNYTIKNYGNDEEITTLTIGQNSSNVWVAPRYLEPITIRTRNITFAPGADFSFIQSWNTSNVHPGFYSIFIQAQLVLDETDASDNIFITDAVMIIALADLDANGQVNIIDISMAAKAYGSVPGEPNWNQDADLNNDGLINILDLSLIAKEFGRIYV